MADGSDTTAPSLMDTSALGGLLRRRRAENGLSLRQAAADAGVSFSTLTRVEDGAQPDLSTFLRLCAWLGVAPTTFFQSPPERQTNGLEAAITHLAADPRLTTQAAEQISSVLRQMYDVLAEQPTMPTAALALHLRATSTMRPGVPTRLASILTDMHTRLVQLVDDGAV